MIIMLMKTFIVFLILSAIPMCAAAPVKIVLVAGRPSHGPGEHEFNAGIDILAKCLKQTKGIEPVIVRGGWPEDEKIFDGAKSVVFYMDGGAGHPFLKDDRLATLGKIMDKGVGMALLHYAVEIPKDNGGKELLQWIGGFYERPYSLNPINDVLVTQASPKHPISRGWKSFTAKDEWYYKIRFTDGDKRVTPILTTMLPKDKPNLETIAWATERADGGRGFGFTGEHYHSNWGIQDFRQMVVNAILWTAKVDVPKKGAKCAVTQADLTTGLDPKPQPKKKK